MKFEKEFIGTKSEIKHDFTKWLIKRTVIEQVTLNPFATVSMLNLGVLDNMLEALNDTTTYRLTFNRITGVMLVYDHDQELANLGIQIIKPETIEVDKVAV